MHKYYAHHRFARQHLLDRISGLMRRRCTARSNCSQGLDTSPETPPHRLPRARTTTKRCGSFDAARLTERDELEMVMFFRAEQVYRKLRLDIPR
jgi:hypothetical protein